MFVSVVQIVICRLFYSTTILAYLVMVLISLLKVLVAAMLALVDDPMCMSACYVIIKQQLYTTK